ncbi:MAG: alpha-E domain-containing protein [Gammaproteobacteria bacterium]|nr:alpha-E domain-containing protein [Gammaproteobacteria bacterium]
MSSLLSRFAENSFWMARYMQRSENLARIIDVNETFARNAEGENEWLPILKLHCDEETYGKLYDKIDGTHVVRFYLIDDRHGNSIRQCAYYARENARSIRHLISLETWTQINVFYNWMRELKARDTRLSELSRLCGKIKDSCELHFGIAESTLYRDQIYLFYRLGQLLELCDQTTRLVDIKYHALLPNVVDVGTPIDVAQWNALLRSASAYHGYRRVFPHEMTPTTVAGFILLDADFPRSIKHCAGRIEQTLDQLLARSELGRVEFDREHLEALKSLAQRSAEKIIDEGLNSYLDVVQQTLNAFGKQINSTFFLAQYAEA